MLTFMLRFFSLAGWGRIKWVRTDSSHPFHVWKYLQTKSMQIFWDQIVSNWSLPNPAIEPSKLCEFITCAPPVVQSVQSVVVKELNCLCKLSSLIFDQKYSLGIELLNLSNCTKALLLEHIIVQDRNSVQRCFVLWADLENTSLV